MKIKAAQASSIVEGKNHCVKLENQKILLVRHKGTIHALENRCPHVGLSLEKGKVENGVITCPWHGSSFDVATGENRDWVNGVLGVSVPKWTAKLISLGKAPQPVRTYPVAIEGDDVMVDLG
ncbi:MAG TPA: Rieske 2Fe-2S domain-containing protein [Dongiaceae bacterium]|nr:Rieske 2Fe-2S domain-containing protein [Dongiaceae bacterium]